MESHAGGCHCGSLQFEFLTAAAPEDMEIRADQCGFCRRHAARAVSDPNGRVIIRVQRQEHLQRYRFGLRTADFLLCSNCGVYVASAMADGDDLYAIVILNAFDAAERFTRTPRPVDYDSEDISARRQRRRTRWTPADLEVA